MRIILFFLMATLVFSSCQRESSADVNQDRIYTFYELVYNADEDITYARAWFKFGSATGTQLELAAPSQVTFEGDKLTFKPLLAFYEKSYAGYKSTGAFVFEDTEGKSYTNSISIKPVQFGAVPDTVLRNAALSVPWTGDVLGEKEYVGVWINGENEGDAQAAATIDQGSSAVIVAANKMSKVGAGPGQIYMERRYGPALSEKTGAGGDINGVYRPKKKNVVFK
jgi:hypothetical protein